MKNLLQENIEMESQRTIAQLVPIWRDLVFADTQADPKKSKSLSRIFSGSYFLPMLELIMRIEI